MADAGKQPPRPPKSGPHLVLYDGECGLCHGLIQFVIARDPRGLFHFAALQGAAAATHLKPFGGVPSQLTTVYVVADYRQESPALLVKSRAALFISRSLGWPWRAASLFAVLPTVLLDRGYDFVARHRHRFFGRRDACLMPSPGNRDRFIDANSVAAPQREGVR